MKIKLNTYLGQIRSSISTGCTKLFAPLSRIIKKLQTVWNDFKWENNLKKAGATPIGTFNGMRVSKLSGPSNLKEVIVHWNKSKRQVEYYITRNNQLVRYYSKQSTSSIRSEVVKKTDQELR
jgi:hypothetical protein